MRGFALLGMLLVGLAACGDPDTNDERGYTKAPLEEPGLLIQGEPETEMPELGEPNRPRVVEPSELAVDTADGS